MAYGNQSQLGNTAAQYPIGTSGDTVALNSGNITRDGTLTQNAFILSRGGSGVPSQSVLGNRIDIGSGGIVFEASGSPSFILPIAAGVQFGFPGNIVATIASGGLTVNTGFPLTAGGAFSANREVIFASNSANGNQSITLASLHDQYYTGTGGHTWTVSNPNGTALNPRFVISNDGSGSFDLSGLFRDGGANVTTVSVPVNSSLMLTSSGARWRTHWYA